MAEFSIHPAAHIGHAQLIVRDLDVMERFYRNGLGFRANRVADNAIELSANGKSPLIVLKHDPGATPKPARTTGLYHLAVRVPSRVELARSLMHMTSAGASPRGMADHNVSEALYLRDPEGNGLEIYADRPREFWPDPRAALESGNKALDVDGLLAEVNGKSEPWSGLAEDTDIGHIHLSVSGIDEADGFYHGLLGFDRIADISGQAGFVSAGGYHHHVAYNVWSGIGIPPPPPNTAGMDYFTVVLPSADALNEVTTRIHSSGFPHEGRNGSVRLADPSRNRIELTSPQE